MLRAKIPLSSWAKQGILIADKIRTIRQGVADLFKQILAPNLADNRQCQGPR
jgi:uracil DNA glycosylase